MKKNPNDSHETVNNVLSGLRQGELRGLHVSDVRFDPPVIRVQLSIEGEEHSPKSRRNRTVPMTSRLTAALRRRLGR